MGKFFIHAMQTNVIVLFVFIRLSHPFPQEGKHYKVNLPQNPDIRVENTSTKSTNPLLALTQGLESLKQSPTGTPASLTKPKNNHETHGVIDELESEISHLMKKLLGLISSSRSPLSTTSSPIVKPELTRSAPQPPNGPTPTAKMQIQCRDQDKPKDSAGEQVWVAASYGEIPSGAFISGKEETDGGEIGHFIYVARASFNGSLIPGKAVPGHLAAYVAYGQWEMPFFNYEVLVAPAQHLEWINFNMEDDVVPHNAVFGGFSLENGDYEAIYVGRALFNAETYYGNYNLNMEVGAFYADRKELKITYKYKSYAVRNIIQILTWKLCD